MTARISVLIPSRRRPDELFASLASLVDKAAEPDDVEFLVRVDRDDAGYSATGIELIEGARHGFEKLHHYANQLGRRAEGDWLLWWHDDARMLTPRWDALVAAHDHTVPQVLKLGVQTAGMNNFPCVSRAFYEALGHLSHSPHVDTWLQDVSRQAGCELFVPGVEIEHRRELEDATRAEARTVRRATSADFYDDKLTERREADAEAVRKAMSEIEHRRELEDADAEPELKMEAPASQAP